jgi:hypothetical protein
LFGAMHHQLHSTNILLSYHIHIAILLRSYCLAFYCHAISLPIAGGSISS